MRVVTIGSTSKQLTPERLGAVLRSRRGLSPAHQIAGEAGRRAVIGALFLGSVLLGLINIDTSSEASDIIPTAPVPAQSSPMLAETASSEGSQAQQDTSPDLVASTSPYDTEALLPGLGRELTPKELIEIYMDEVTASPDNPLVGIISGNLGK